MGFFQLFRRQDWRIRNERRKRSPVVLSAPGGMTTGLSRAITFGAAAGSIGPNWTATLDNSYSPAHHGEAAGMGPGGDGGHAGDADAGDIGGDSGS